MIGQLVNTPITLPLWILVDQKTNGALINIIQILGQKVIPYYFDVFNMPLLEILCYLVCFRCRNKNTGNVWVTINNSVQLCNKQGSIASV